MQTMKPGRPFSEGSYNKLIASYVYMPSLGLLSIMFCISLRHENPSVTTCVGLPSNKLVVLFNIAQVSKLSPKTPLG